MEELIYTPIPDNEKYEITKDGKIRYMKDGQYNYNLKCNKDKSGYIRVTLRKNGINKGYGLHRLVAQTYIPNSENKPQVNHIDGNKQNNAVTNLEWNTALENIRHAIETRLRDPGVHCSVKDITTDEIIHFKDTRELGKFLNISHVIIFKYVARSKYFPIKDRYEIIVEIDNTKIRYNSATLYVYDHVNESLTYYESKVNATLITGISPSTYGMPLVKTDYFYTAGYTFSNKDKGFLKVDKDKALKDRMKMYKKMVIHTNNKKEKVMEEEIYKKVPTLKGVEASNLGNIRIKVGDKFNQINTKSNEGSEIKRLVFKVNGVKQKRAVHKIIAEAWIPNPNNYVIVRHKDKDKNNHKVSNLEWVSQSDALNDTYETNPRTDSVTGTVLDKETNETHKFNSVSKMAKFLDIPISSLLQYVVRSKTLPVRLRYILDIKLEDTITKDNIINVFVYDHVDKSEHIYKSLNQATLATGVSQTTYAKELKDKESYYIAGYTFSYKHVEPTLIEVDKAKDDRVKLYIKPIAYVTRTIELYNYETKEVIECIERDDVLKYVETSKDGINNILARIDYAKRTWLIGGYGIRRLNQQYEWYPYTAVEILNSKLGNKFDAAIYRLNVEGKEEELIYSSKQAMELTKLPKTTFGDKVLKKPNGYDFEIDSLKANIRKY